MVVVNHILVSTEVGDKVVDVISSLLLLVLVLIAASGGVDWIRVNICVNINISTSLNLEVVICWEIPLSFFLFLVLQVLQGINDILVSSKVWDIWRIIS